MNVPEVVPHVEQRELVNMVLNLLLNEFHGVRQVGRVTSQRGQRRDVLRFPQSH